MQLIRHKSHLLSLFYTITVASTIVCAPTDAPETSDLEKANAHAQDSTAPLAAVANNHDTTGDAQHHRITSYHQQTSAQISKKELDNDYYYKFRTVVGEGVKKALDECRQKFKWDRWNCPLKSFKSIMSPDDYALAPMPSNKELGLTRALISAGIVLSIVQSCSKGTNSLCSCSNAIMMPQQSAEIFLASGAVPPTSPVSTDQSTYWATNQVRANLHPSEPSQAASYQRYSNSYDDDAAAVASAQQVAPSVAAQQAQANADMSQPVNSKKFVWAGCDEVIKLSFKVAKAYLNPPDKGPGSDASQLINAHNFEAGRQAVKRTMRRRCKCHGPSGACQMYTCWRELPEMSEVGDYLKRQYRVAAKVGEMTANESNAGSLLLELSAIGTDKLVFADASPDYCYENKQLGINGTLGRYCSRPKYQNNGTEISRSERDSCDRLCTKCGYKIKKEKITVERQCDCRFAYCCYIECQKCHKVEDAYKCVRHS